MCGTEGYSWETISLIWSTLNSRNVRKSGILIYGIAQNLNHFFLSAFLEKFCIFPHFLLFFWKVNILNNAFPFFEKINHFSHLLPEVAFFGISIPRKNYDTGISGPEIKTSEHRGFSGNLGDKNPGTQEIPNHFLDFLIYSGRPLFCNFRTRKLRTKLGAHYKIRGPYRLFCTR